MNQDTALRDAILDRLGAESAEAVAAAVATDVAAFARLLDAVDAVTAPVLAELRAGVQDQVAATACDDLDRQGFAIVPGLFADPAFLSAARARTAHLADQVRAWHRSNPGTTEQHAAEERVRFSAGAAAYDCAQSGLPLIGRARAYWRPSYGRGGPNTPFAAVFDHPVIAAVFAAADYPLQGNTDVLAERLEPSVRADLWHIDRYYPQLKCAVLLTDTEFRHGPTRYKAGTHRNADPHKVRLVHAYFTLGIGYAYPPGPVVSAMPGTEVHFTGRAGDVVFFNTNGIHSGQRCLDGERLSLTVQPNSRAITQRLLMPFQPTSPPPVREPEPGQVDPVAFGQDRSRSD